jgi:hypothetical protein
MSEWQKQALKGLAEASEHIVKLHKDHGREMEALANRQLPSSTEKAALETGKLQHFIFS